jgi:hypothetical protein
MVVMPVDADVAQGILAGVIWRYVYLLGALLYDGLRVLWFLRHKLALQERTPENLR